MQTDIEIYLLKPEQEALNQWLMARFGQLGANPWPNLPQGAWGGMVIWQQQNIPIMLVPKASGQFASLWFNSPNTPWPDDLSCAQEIHAALGIEVRCSPSGWQEDKDSELWYQLRQGQLNLIPWH